MPDVILFTAPRFHDDRGWFTECYNSRRESNIGIESVFVQDNVSFSSNIGTIRGIHFQLPPREQEKLVRCSRGRIIDYAVDLRNGSPTYGKHVSTELSHENGHQLYIPAGFGHGFVTLEDATEVSYKVSDFYSVDCDSGVRWDCPDIAIEWPVGQADAILSDKDRALPLLEHFESPFTYDGKPLELRVID